MSMPIYKHEHDEVTFFVPTNIVFKTYLNVKLLPQERELQCIHSKNRQFSFPSKVVCILINHIKTVVLSHLFHYTV